MRQEGKEEKIIEIRQSGLNELASIKMVHEAAFERRAEADLVQAIMKSPEFVPELSLGAYVEDKHLVGHILFSLVEFDRSKEKRALALAPVAILPDYQRQGIGSALIEKGIDVADAEDYSAIIVLGDGSYYERFGFKKAMEFDIHPPFEVDDENYRVVPLSAYRKNIVGKVIYHQAFQSV